MYGIYCLNLEYSRGEAVHPTCMFRINLSRCWVCHEQSIEESPIRMILLGCANLTLFPKLTGSSLQRRLPSSAIGRLQEARDNLWFV